jgi:hypothetical protein
VTGLVCSFGAPQSTVLQGPPRAAFNDGADLFRGGVVGEDSRASVPVENDRQPSDALGGVDAEVTV